MVERTSFKASFKTILKHQDEDNYQILRQIGQGSFAEVFKA